MDQPECKRQINRRQFSLLQINRRQFLLASAACALATPGAAHANDTALSAARLQEIAKAVIARYGRDAAYVDRIALADFSPSSATPRFHIVDMIDGGASAHLVAHGRGSDPAHSGFLKSFSNEPGSNATSSGAYLTGAHYDGKYGRSIRLAGLDATNSNAAARAIVIHTAWYVSEAMIARYGKLGRSEGCLTLAADGLERALARLGPGRLVYAGKLASFET